MSEWGLTQPFCNEISAADLLKHTSRDAGCLDGGPHTATAEGIGVVPSLLQQSNAIVEVCSCTPDVRFAIVLHLFEGGVMKPGVSACMVREEKVLHTHLDRQGAAEQLRSHLRVFVTQGGRLEDQFFCGSQLRLFLARHSSTDSGLRL